MTRDDDSTVSSEERAAIANDCDADLYLALHRNYAANPEACGVEAWIYSSGSEKKPCDRRYHPVQSGKGRNLR